MVATDDAIDAAELLIEKSAIDLLSLYRPLATDFRVALMTLKANGELERIADCAGNAAGQVAAITADAERVGTAYRVPTALADLAAAGGGDVPADGQGVQLHRRRRRRRKSSAATVALMRLYAQVLQEASAELRGESDRRERQLAFIMAAKNLERIGDHCTNVAEDVLYIARGELVRHRQAV